MGKNVVVIGLGYVGLPLALLVHSKGYSVTGIDFDNDKLDLIRKRISPFVDEEISKKLVSYPIEVQNDYQNSDKADILIVCVPTPVDDNFMPDLSPVRSVCEHIGRNLRSGQIVIIESTINPGVCDDIIIPILEKYSGLTCGSDFSLAHCPERINPGDTTWNVSNIPRVVGANDDRSLQSAVAFYESIITGQIKPMGSLKEAEAVKVVENSFRDINIAFVNELAMSFSMLGIDVVNVIDGAATKPFAFMPHYPGAGVGGHCIPVDPYYLIEYAKSKGFSHKFLRVAREINNGMPKFVIKRLHQALKERKLKIDGLPVTVLGLSYKPGVGDLRESPALKILDELVSAGAKVTAYDPFIAKIDKTNVHIAKSLSTSIESSSAIIIATAHKDFLNLDYTLLAKNGIKVIIDGRNCLDRQRVECAGIVYKGIGR